MACACSGTSILTYLGCLWYMWGHACAIFPTLKCGMALGENLPLTQGEACSADFVLPSFQFLRLEVVTFRLSSLPLCMQIWHSSSTSCR